MSCVTKTIVRPDGLQRRERVEALLLEGGVADGEHLVDEQDVRVGLDRDREGEPDVHPRRVVLELEVHELLELGERDDVVEALARLAARQPEHDRVDDHVLARGQLRVEADAELDERREAAVHLHVAAVDLVDARQALEQRALAGAVAADDAEELALRDHRGSRRRRRAARRTSGCERMQRPLLERHVLLVGEAEASCERPRPPRRVAPRARRPRPRVTGCPRRCASGPTLAMAVQHA